jgi:hypothetical protein
VFVFVSKDYHIKKRKSDMILLTGRVVSALAENKKEG